MALLAIATAAAWWFLPAIVQAAFDRGTTALGFERASVDVERADLSGLRATEMLLRLGGLEVSLDEGTAEYSVGELLGGRVRRVVVEGLTATLDFTRPRRGVLPDAVDDLRARLGGGGELVWPVDDLELRNCRLVLALPGGTETIAITATASRQADGRVAFELRTTNPAVNLHVSGAVRTETMDGEVTVHEFSVQPGFVFAVARQLGLFELPRDATLSSERLTLTGTTTLAAGMPATYVGRMQAPAIRVRVGGNVVTLDDVDGRLRQDSGSAISGSLAATLHGAGADRAWTVGPAALALDLGEGKLTGGIPAGFPFAATDAVKGSASLRVASGVPVLGGPAHGELVLTVSELETDAIELAPVVATIAGWTEQVDLTIPEIRLRDGAPAALTDFRATLSHPLDPGRALEGSLGVVVDEAARTLLPAGWTLAEPVLPAGIARLDFRATLADAGPSATVIARSTLPRVRVAAGESAYAATPRVEVTTIADATGATATAAVNLDAVELPPAALLPGFNAATLAIELPRTSYADLLAVAKRASPEQDVGLTIKATAARSAMTANLEVNLRRPATTTGWQTGARAAISGMSGDFAGMKFADGSAEATIDLGPITDEQLDATREGAEPLALVRTLGRQAKVDVSLSANGLDLPGGVRLQWLGATLAKPRADPAGPAWAGTLAVHAGALRVASELVEQPVLDVAFAGDLDALEATAGLQGLFEGAPLGLKAKHVLRRDPAQGTFAGDLDVSLAPFTFTNSDVVSRWAPTLPGIAFSGTLDGHATLHYGDGIDTDGTAAIEVRNGLVNYPAQKFRGEGLFARIELDSWRNLRMEPGQEAGFSRVSVGDIVAKDVSARFWTAGPTVFHIESVELGIFDGALTAEPFSLYFPDPDVALDLRMRDLDANEVVRTFQIFDGTLQGRLRGRLPVGLLAGRPIIGEGFLELEDNQPASFSFDTKGFFTVGLPDESTVEQLNRLPYELLEDGLKDLQLRKFRVDLFRRDRPGTPVDVALDGVAHTRRADVPIGIEVHVNGSVREVVEQIVAVIMK